MKRLDLISATAMLALVIVVVVATNDMAFWRGVSPGPRFLPLLLSGWAALMAIALILQVWRTPQGASVDWPDRPGITRITLLYVAAIGFGLTGAAVGFITAAMIFLLFTLVIVLRQPVLPSLLTTGITTGIVYSVFINWLNIRLPEGPFGF